MTTCCLEDSIDHQFDAAHVRDEMLRYRRKGARTVTRILLEAIKVECPQNVSLLDIGGRIGTIAHELLMQGTEHATVVEMAESYVEAGRTEAERRGVAGRITYIQGDFVRLAPEIGSADIVTLDRVVCCYPDCKHLVASSVAKARIWYALSYPRDRWYVKVGGAIKNRRRRRRGNSFRTFVHAPHEIDAQIVATGFDRHFHRCTIGWEVAIYRRMKFA